MIQYTCAAPNVAKLQYLYETSLFSLAFEFLKLHAFSSAFLYTQYWYSIGILLSK